MIVTFTQGAQIKNPSARGEAGSPGTVSAGSVETSQDTMAAYLATALAFEETISLDKTKSPEGGAVEVTVGGFTPGLQVTASGAVTGSDIVKRDGTAVISGTMGDSTGEVLVKDGAGLTAESETITVTATLTVTATGKAQDEITLDGKNYGNDDDVDDNISIEYGIEFGGETLDIRNVVATAPEKTAKVIALKTSTDQDTVKDDFSIKIKIPSNAPSGMNQIEVTDSTGNAATATVNVAARTVTLSPSSGPPGLR